MLFRLEFLSHRQYMMEGGHSWNNGKHLHEVLVPVNYKYFLVHYASYPIAMCFMETLHHQKIDIDRFKEQQIKCYYFVVLNWCFHGQFSPSSLHSIRNCEGMTYAIFQDERILLFLIEILGVIEHESCRHQELLSENLTQNIQSGRCKCMQWRCIREKSASRIPECEESSRR